MGKTEQQKIYIDVDEEITTVIDRLHRVNDNNVALVVPQHALILQSVVNLKLLAQEAKKRKKNIVLMTRDENGIAFATRAGVAVQPYMSEEDGDLSEKVVMQSQSQQKVVPTYTKKIMNEKSEHRVQTDMGSQAFFAGTTSQSANMSGITARCESSNHVMTQGRETRVRGKNAQMDMMHKKQESINDHNIEQHTNKLKQTVQRSDEADHFEEYERSLHNAKLSNLHEQNNQHEKLHSHSHAQYEDSYIEEPKKKVVKKPKKIKNQNGDIPMSGSTRFAVKSFIFGGIALIVFIVLIALLPKTKISVDPKEIKVDEQMEMTAQIDQNVYDADRRLIPARLIERDVTFTKSFDATGSGDVTAQKAQGTITIFNEYSTAPQPLVVTTRFLAQDGALFRLVNQTTVPGMNGDEPGKVEALIIADQEGSDGNIDPSRFSVPGFEGSPKKDKFYAISDRSMTGGGMGGTGVTLITEEDIVRAEAEMTKEMPQYITEQINGLLRPENEIFTKDSVMSETIRSEANISEGTMADQFMYEIVGHVKAIVFSQDDVLAVIESNLADKYHQYSSEQVDMHIEYEDIVANFENETIKMKANGMADIITTVDMKLFKKDIIGKKHSDLLTIMENDYNDEIEKITIENVVPGFPTFIANRISRFGFMTDVFVK